METKTNGVSFIQRIFRREGDDPTIRKRYMIHGKVQGVGYRKWTKKKALELGLDGYCRNLTDGTVEVVVSGKDKKTIKTFEALLTDGPRKARVDKVQNKKRKKDVKPGFKIKKTK